MSADTQPFYLENGRAMVSLGPASPTRHCSFRCPFCYVESPDFVKYKPWPVERIIEWLRANLNQIRVIYVSGDTDSFAPPRTSVGLDLLRALAELDRDLLFTTRHVFTKPSHWQELTHIAARVSQAKKVPISCVSICQLSRPELEPPPIAPPTDRINELASLRAAGWLPVLAMRPILPGVPSQDFEQILQLSAPHTRYCLISDYYFDPASPQWQPESGEAKKVGQLYFDIGGYSDWHKVEPEQKVLDTILSAAANLGIEVFDRSDALYEAICSGQGASS